MILQCTLYCVLRLFFLTNMFLAATADQRDWARDKPTTTADHNLHRPHHSHFISHIGRLLLPLHASPHRPKTGPTAQRKSAGHPRIWQVWREMERPHAHQPGEFANVALPRITIIEYWCLQKTRFCGIFCTTIKLKSRVVHSTALNKPGENPVIFDNTRRWSSAALL